MKTLQKLLIGSASLLLVAVMFTACSSDDDDTQSTEDALVLEGKWQFDKMDFLDKEDVEWDTSEIPFNPRAALGYAPYMFDVAEISGFIFGNADVLDGEGNVIGQRFDYTMGEDYEAPGFDANVKYWYWNYKDDQKSFEIIQQEGGPIPHDFTLHDIRDISVLNDGEKIVFTADMETRVVGGEMNDTMLTPIEFTILKGSPSRYVEVYIDGEPYVQPVNPEGEPQ